MKFSTLDTGQRRVAPQEGDLFKTIRICGKTFEIRYGFYEERDRHTRFAEPVPIYPDFIELPQYTADGIPFATAMQNPCESFVGKKDANSGCGDCAFYRACEELLGVCTCPVNHRRTMRNQRIGAEQPGSTVISSVSIQGGLLYDS